MDNKLLHKNTWIWVVYLVLFALSVPWYLPDIDPVPLWFGMPYWVVVSLSACVCIAVFTAFVIRRFWPENNE